MNPITPASLDRRRLVKKALAECRDDDGYMPGTMAERLAVMWELTEDVWSFMPEADAQSRLPRHIAQLVRRA